MSFDLTEETLEEGRVALFQLERQLKERNSLNANDNFSESSSKHSSSNYERRMLDQVPRVARLNQRLESLGLTVEQLDDRGLLDGGGSMPSYYTSMKQKSRRSLELQPRSHRLQERGKESLSKLLNGLWHMMRLLESRGLNIEARCRQSDAERRGLMHKRKFAAMLCNIGLPLISRDLIEIVQHYSVPSSDQVDYVSLLKDADVLSKTAAAGFEGDTNTNEATTPQSSKPIGVHTSVLVDVKRMLLDSLRSLNKHQDDVYRMFARWDTQGTGTVTATQFLRVLARLHVNLSDQDQDFLVELLDINAKGRIDFDSLLNFCFADSEILSPKGMVITSSHDDMGDESVSAVSTDKNSVDMKGSANSRGRSRPHTATLSRPYNDKSAFSVENYINGAMSNNGNVVGQRGGVDPRTGTTAGGGSGENHGLRDGFTGASGQGRRNKGGGVEEGGVSGSVGSPHGQRPQTASAVRASAGTAAGRGRGSSSSSSSQQQQQFNSAGNDVYMYNTNNANKSASNMSAAAAAERSRTAHAFDHIDADITNEDDELEPMRQIHSRHQRPMDKAPNNGYYSQAGVGGGHISSFSRQPQQGTSGGSAEIDIDDLPDNLDGVRIQEQDVPNADREESKYGTHKDIASFTVNSGGGGRDGKNANGSTNTFSIDGVTDSSNSQPHSRRQQLVLQNSEGNNNNNNNGGGGGARGEDTEPTDHLVLLANQILGTLREIILTRYRRGKSLQEIYQHFDRDEKLYFDAADFVKATCDLRIETSERVAAIAIHQLAIDGYDQVSFGEFKVFVLDSDHKLLELQLQQQLAQMLEQQGREYRQWMADAFLQHEEELNDPSGAGGSGGGGGSNSSNGLRNSKQSSFVSKAAFINALHAIGAVLTPAEVGRVVVRFDMHGQGMCSWTRFVRMIHDSAAWRDAERVLLYQDEAIEEANFLLTSLRNGVTVFSDGSPLPNLPEDLINMCEYLGIRVLSEQNMVWIAADALKAPLPVSWAAQKDANGRTYFYNHLTNQSKWEHPLDPHFRKLRDKYRQSAVHPNDNHKTSSASGRGAGVHTSNATSTYAQLNAQPPPRISDYGYTPPSLLRPVSATVGSSSNNKQSSMPLHAVRADGQSSGGRRPQSAALQQERHAPSQPQQQTNSNGINGQQQQTMNTAPKAMQPQPPPPLQYQYYQPINGGDGGDVAPNNPAQDLQRLYDNLAAGNGAAQGADGGGGGGKRSASQRPSSAPLDMGGSNNYNASAPSGITGPSLPMMMSSTGAGVGYSGNGNLHQQLPPSRRVFQQDPSAPFNLNASKAKSEAIYGSSYLKSPAANYLVGGSGADTGGVGRTGAGGNSSSNNHTSSGLLGSRSRPVSGSRGRPPQQPQPTQQQPVASVVDRALSLNNGGALTGTHSNSLLGAGGGGASALLGGGGGGADKQRRNSKLNEMFEGNIIEKLDNAIINSKRHQG